MPTDSSAGSASSELHAPQCFRSLFASFFGTRKKGTRDRLQPLSAPLWRLHSSRPYWCWPTEPQPPRSLVSRTSSTGSSAASPPTPMTTAESAPTAHPPRQEAPSTAAATWPIPVTIVCCQAEAGAKDWRDPARSGLVYPMRADPGPIYLRWQRVIQKR